MATRTTEQQLQAIERVRLAIDTIKSGKMVIMVDDEDRENEGDLVFAAEDASPEHINFMAKYARGLVCLPMSAEYINRLQLPMMSDHSKSDESMGTAFTVSIEAKHGVSTGISASDRARTIQVAIDDQSVPSDIVVPGHIFPLKAKPSGVLERAGHTEGSVDLARLAGKKPAGVICEIMNDDGSMARRSDLEVFSKEHSIPIVSIEDLITYRLLHESTIEVLGSKPVPTRYGTFDGVWFRNNQDGTVHFALTKGGPFDSNITDVRVHRQRPLLDILASLGAEEDSKLNYGLKLLSESGQAAFIYLSVGSQTPEMEKDYKTFLGESVGTPSEGRGADNAPAMDPRLYGIGAQILRHLGVKRMRLHVSSPISLVGLGGFGLEIEETAVMKSK